jgi:hypothetical protein
VSINGASSPFIAPRVRLVKRYTGRVTADSSLEQKGRADVPCVPFPIVTVSICTGVKSGILSSHLQDRTTPHLQNRRRVGDAARDGVPSNGTDPTSGSVNGEVPACEFCFAVSRSYVPLS